MSESGKSEMTLRRLRVHREADEEWVQMIEESLPALDAALRDPSRSIREATELVPVHRMRETRPRAVRHLARHTEDLQRGPNGTVKPVRLLDTRSEETLLVYENRFLNTLIRRLAAFVERRVEQLKARGSGDDTVMLRLDATFPDGVRQGRVRLEMETVCLREAERNHLLTARVERLLRITRGYASSPFAVRMAAYTVRPPILATNAILRNKHLSQCLRLFRYLEAYDRVGERVTREECDLVPTEDYRDGVAGDILQQYQSFLHEIGEAPPSAEQHVTRDSFRPRMVTRVEEDPIEDARDYEAVQTECRRVFALSYGDGNPYRLETEERAVCLSVEAALEADEIRRGGGEWAHEAGGGWAVVNLDTLCVVFDDDSQVTPQWMDVYHLIPAAAGRVKVLARGRITKRLHVVADAFSAEAIRYITEAGGTARLRRPDE